MEKIYDIVLFGATGFTGKLTAEYLAQQYGIQPFRFALAGRNLDKLSSIQKELESKFPGISIDLLYADSHRQESLLEMTRKTKVVATTVGPYLQFGDPLVKACVEGGAHYADITGEGRFVENMVRLYHKKAKANKVKIVNCCGYDSIPADLGVFYAMQGISDASTVEVECLIHVDSNPNDPLAGWKSFSGGTWHSAIGMMDTSEMERRETFLTYIASTANPRKISVSPFRLKYRENKNWIGVPVPFVDTEIVLRSAAYYDFYGKDFSYNHYLGLNGFGSLFLGAIGVSAIFSLSQFEFTRNLLLSLKSSGDGPPLEVRETNQFTHSILVKTNKGNSLVEVSGGDPGYGDTAKMLGESVLCLLEDKPDSEYGVITPSVAMGDNLVKRLQNAKIRFQRL